MGSSKKVKTAKFFNMCVKLLKSSTFYQPCGAIHKKNYLLFTKFFLSKLFIQLLYLFSFLDCHLDTAIILQVPPSRVSTDSFISMLIDLEASLCPDSKIGIILAGKTVRVVRKLTCKDGMECTFKVAEALKTELAYPPKA